MLFILKLPKQDLQTKERRETAVNRPNPENSIIKLDNPSLAVPAGGWTGAPGGAGRPPPAPGGRGQGPARACHGRQAQGRAGDTLSPCQVMTRYYVSMLSDII